MTSGVYVVATCAAGVAGDEFVDDEAVDDFGDGVGHAEVQPADRVGIDLYL